MKIGLIQVASPPDEPVHQRRQRVGQMVTETRGVDLIVLPELWAPGYFAFDRYDDLAEPLHGETVAAGRDWARQLNAHVHLGSVLERSSQGQLHNTAVLIAPDGRVVHTYRKMHVFGYQSREAELLTGGEAVSIVEGPLGPTSSTTCYDLRFPELWRGLVEYGAESVVVPAAWPAARRTHWQLFTTTRAVEQQVMVIACNAVGEQNGKLLGGYSRIVDAWGEVLAEGGTDEGPLVCEVDPTITGQVRSQFPVLADRRLANTLPRQHDPVTESTGEGAPS